MLGGAALVCGCAGGLGSLLGAGLFALALLLQGCTDDESCNDYQVCVDGELTTERLCCPSGTECNYGQWAPTICRDGSCVEHGYCPGEAPDGGAGGAGPDAGRDGGESCSGLECDCDGYVAQSCESGELVDVCCPMGVACNYGLGLRICPDGSCTYSAYGCEPMCEADAGSESCGDGG
jgi:hypothetical protein